MDNSKKNSARTIRDTTPRTFRDTLLSVHVQLGTFSLDCARNFRHTSIRTIKYILHAKYLNNKPLRNPNTRARFNTEIF